MDYKALLQKIDNHYKSGLPFVLYSLPDDDLLTCYFQRDNVLHPVKDFSEKGVKFAAFDNKNATFCMSAANCEILETNYTPQRAPLDKIAIVEVNKERLNYKRLVGKAIKSIEEKKASKIVVSRRKTLALKETNLDIIISRLLNFFPEAFNYVWYHPTTGLWFGATPELLLKTDGIAFSTMALAGTKRVEEGHQPDWTLKETIEQQFVTDAITASLQKLTSVVKISKTYTQVAGSVAHLRTDISGALKNGKATLDIIASALHPTPAVCGTPRDFSHEFIKNNEGYDREFYTGFVGPVDQNKNSSQLFVNLRCVKIESNVANLYVGGGVTSVSNERDEWKETQNKLQTMLQVLKPLLC